MKPYYILQVHGDFDLCINGEVHEDDVYLFKTIDTEKMIAILNRLEVTPRDKDKAYVVGPFRKRIKMAISFLESWNGKSHISFDYGGNQFIKIETKYMPEDSDFEV